MTSVPPRSPLLEIDRPPSVFDNVSGGETAPATKMGQQTGRNRDRGQTLALIDGA